MVWQSMGLMTGTHIVGKSQEVEAQIQCGCHTERLIVSKWDDDEFPAEVYFCMWNMSGYDPSKLRWRAKWRSIWRIIRKGEPYLDQVTVSEDEAQELGIWLILHTQKSVENEARS